jgi:dCMP deaminase
MGLCFMIAMRSPDPSTKLGAVIVAPDNRVVASGYNGWPRGVKEFADDDPRWERPLKYAWMAHAERNALDNALRAGIAVEGYTIYNPIMPCVECARGIVQSGIKRVVYFGNAQAHFERNVTKDQTWFEAMAVVKQMFEEAGVELIEMTEPIPRFESLVCGQSFDPHIKNVKAIKGLVVKADILKAPLSDPDAF